MQIDGITKQQKDCPDDLDGQTVTRTDARPAQAGVM